jgi:hypothetical protein
MFVAWVLFPLVLVAVCLGCGLLVERIAGWELPDGLLVSLGLVAVIVVATLATDRAKTAPLATASVLALALAGYASSWRRLRRLRPPGWALAAALGVYCVAAAPVVASGSAAFLGYFQLNDTNVHFSLIAHMLAHGRDLSGLANSSYAGVVRGYTDSSYPIGAQVALGAVRPLIGQDTAWVFQPYLAVILALGALTLYELMSGLVASRAMRAVCAFVAAQPFIYYAFYLQAAVKEVATAWIVPLAVVLVVETLRRRVTIRSVVPLLLIAVAGLDVLDLAIIPWLGFPAAAFILAAGWRLRHVAPEAAGRMWLSLAATLAAAAVLAEPIIARASTFFNTANAVLTTPGDLGNLASPLSNWEAFGIWPSGDFRFLVAGHLHVAFVLIGIALISSVFGAVWALRTRAFGPLLLIAGNSIAAAYLLSRASPYASAKVLAIFSVTVVFAAMLAAASLHASGLRREGWALALVLAGSVLWSNALAYRGSSVAPRDRLGELSSIGDRFAGRGPALYNQSDEFAAYFLRRADPIDVAYTAPGARPDLSARTPGQSRLPWDPDELALSSIDGYHLLVLGRSPRISRPPASFRLVDEGRFYDVWRKEAAPTVLKHVPLGGSLQPDAVPTCALVRKLAGEAARQHARLAYVPRAPVPAFIPTKQARPPNWGLIDGEPFGLIPREQHGSVIGPVTVPSSGRYQVWIQGSFGERVTVSIGGRKVGSVSYEIGPPGQFIEIGNSQLAAGKPQVVITWPGSGTDPGAESIDHALGPLMLVPEGTRTDVTQIAPSQAGSLCRRSLDWIEIVR